VGGHETRGPKMGFTRLDRWNGSGKGRGQGVRVYGCVQEGFFFLK
jgi:hypothetical protein